MNELLTLTNIVKALRGDGGCPWDRSQTLESMQPYLLEECYEVLESMAVNNSDQLREELGDLLFVVLLVGDIAGHSPDSVAKTISEKMVQRHPHVFGNAKTKAENSDNPGGIAAWEARKTVRKSRLDGVPQTLPALLRAHRQGEKASAVGFDWQDRTGVMDKLHEEISELQVALKSGNQEEITHEYGDTLLALANLGRHINCPPEASLRQANDRFSQRFGHMESSAKSMGVDISSLDDSQLDTLWEKAKEALYEG